MQRGMYITGTDTGVGKTLITGLLGRFLTEKGIEAVTQKWVQTGVPKNGQGDIDVHLNFMGQGDLYRLFNEEMMPYVFTHPSSPHLAALLQKTKIKEEKIIKAYKKLSENFEIVIVEGTGGFLVPITFKKTTADIVKTLKLPVLIVAENCLGAINKTLLTIEALKSRKIKVVGVIFNRLVADQDELVLKDNLEIVEKISKVKVFGELQYSDDFMDLYNKFLPIGEKVYKKMRNR